MPPAYLRLFFFNDTATTEIYTLSLHDALPIYGCMAGALRQERALCPVKSLLSPIHSSARRARSPDSDRKSTRLNSSHANISYAVFCLKKKKQRAEAVAGRGRCPSAARGAQPTR